MPELTELLHRAGSALPDEAPSIAEVEADVARGRRRVARVRRRRALTASLALAGATASAIALAQGSGPSPARPGIARRPAVVQQPVAVTPTVTPHLALAAYTGHQVAGFRVAYVPDGWDLTLVDRYTVVMSPSDGSAPACAGVEVAPGSTAPPCIDFRGRIAAEVTANKPYSGTPVPVNGKNATLATSPDGTRTLFVPLASHRFLSIQVWSGIDLTNAQIVRLAEGITVTATAKPVGG